MAKRALLSVSDKSGIVEFAKGLLDLGFEIVSTGGTKRALAEAGLPVTGVSEITGFPECLDGRVKTLHPKIHAGILAMRSNPEHMQQLSDLGVDTIDVVAINLYPFKQTIQKEGVSLAEAIENIDIGGPTMIRIRRLYFIRRSAHAAALWQRPDSCTAKNFLIIILMMPTVRWTW